MRIDYFSITRFAGRESRDAEKSEGESNGTSICQCSETKGYVLSVDGEMGGGHVHA